MSAATKQVFAHRSYKSKSNPDRRYSVRLFMDGTAHCTCPAWKFQKQTPAKRTCKHTDRAAATVLGGVTQGVYKVVAR